MAKRKAQVGDFLVKINGNAHGFKDGDVGRVETSVSSGVVKVKSLVGSHSIDIWAEELNNYKPNQPLFKFM